MLQLFDLRERKLMPSRFSKFVQQVTDTAHDPQQLRKAAHVGKAVFDGALKDVTGHDGKIKKRKIVRRALQPTKTVRRSIANATDAALSAAHTAPMPPADSGVREVEVTTGQLEPIVQGLLDEHFEGQFESYLSKTPTPETAWVFRRGAALSGIQILRGEEDGDGAMLQITSGIVIDVPLTTEMYREVALASGHYYYGRFFVVEGADTNLVVVREIIDGTLFDVGFTASREPFVMTLDNVSGIADSLVGEYIDRFGGRALDPADFPLLNLA
jgi:hypothetical protein